MASDTCKIVGKITVDGDIEPATKSKGYTEDDVMQCLAYKKEQGMYGKIILSLEKGNVTTIRCQESYFYQASEVPWKNK